MRLYEFAVVLKSSLNDTQRKKVVDSLKTMLKGLKVTKEEDLGQKNLSYKIKGETTGRYLLLKLEGENGIPTDFEKKLMSNDDILRHLLLRTK